MEQEAADELASLKGHGGVAAWPFDPVTLTLKVTLVASMSKTSAATLVGDHAPPHGMSQMSARVTSTTRQPRGSASMCVMGNDPEAIQRARSILAKIVLGLAKVGTIDQDMLKHKSIVAYQVKSGGMSRALSSLSRLIEWSLNGKAALQRPFFTRVIAPCEARARTRCRARPMTEFRPPPRQPAPASAGRPGGALFALSDAPVCYC